MPFTHEKPRVSSTTTIPLFLRRPPKLTMAPICSASCRWPIPP